MSQVCETLVEQAADASLDTIIALEVAAHREEQKLADELRGLTPGTPEGSATYARMVEYGRAVSALRRIVRNHPDHSYEGL